MKKKRIPNVHQRDIFRLVKDSKGDSTVTLIFYGDTKTHHINLDDHLVADLVRALNAHVRYRMTVAKGLRDQFNNAANPEETT